MLLKYCVAIADKTHMDPWQPCPANSGDGDDADETRVVVNPVDLAFDGDNSQEPEGEKNTNQVTISEDCSQQEQNCTVDLSFENNFQPFVKLPDSQEYLESLGRIFAQQKILS